MSRMHPLFQQIFDDFGLMKHVERPAPVTPRHLMGEEGAVTSARLPSREQETETARTPGRATDGETPDAGTNPGTGI